MRSRSAGTLAALCVACASSPTDNAAAPACTGAVTISVSAGTVPTFDWTPTCKLFFLNVEDGVGVDQWGVITNGTNGLYPPITYGVVPPHATQHTPGVAPLSTGTPYTVLAFRWTGPGAQDGVASGNQPFTPYRIVGRLTTPLTVARGPDAVR